MTINEDNETQIITMDGKYTTRNGKNVTILCINANGVSSNRPVITIVHKLYGDGHDGIVCYSINGKFTTNDSEWDLIPYNPYKDFKLDDKVMVSMDNIIWYPRHFAGIKNNKPCALNNGESHWTRWPLAETMIEWEFIRKPTEDEMNKYLSKINQKE